MKYFMNKIITGIIKGQEVLFSRNKNRSDKPDVKRKMKERPANFMDQEDDWVRSDLELNKNLYYKDFFHIGETCNEKFS